MSINKIRPGHETVVLVPAVEIAGVPNLAGTTSLVPITAPTTAVLNRWAAITNEGQANFGAGGNVSTALRNDLKLGLDASVADKDRALTATGDAQILTYSKFSAAFTIFRDQLLTALGTFNMAKNLVRAADVPYVIVHRVGRKNTELFQVGDEIDLYYAWTDNPVPGYTADGNQFITQTFVAKNIVNISFTLTV